MNIFYIFIPPTWLTLDQIWELCECPYIQKITCIEQRLKVFFAECSSLNNLFLSDNTANIELLTGNVTRTLVYFIFQGFIFFYWVNGRRGCHTFNGSFLSVVYKVSRYVCIPIAIGEKKSLLIFWLRNLCYTDFFFALAQTQEKDIQSLQTWISYISLLSVKTFYLWAVFDNL